MKFSDWIARTDDFVSIDANTCDRLVNAARTSSRKRSHLLLHESHTDPVQRLMVAFASGTYIQPHRHPAQWEMIMPMRGTLALLLFSEDGKVTAKTELSAESTPTLQITAGVLHTLIAVTPSALMLEIKSGPFRPAQFFDRFPTENTASAIQAAKWLISAEIGDRWQG
jgi:cupin fold WbuC family metalloprotein